MALGCHRHRRPVDALLWQALATGDYGRLLLLDLEWRCPSPPFSDDESFAVSPSSPSPVSERSLSPTFLLSPSPSSSLPISTPALSPSYLLPSPSPASSLPALSPSPSSHLLPSPYPYGTPVSTPSCSSSAVVDGIAVHPPIPARVHSMSFEVSKTLDRLGSAESLKSLVLPPSNFNEPPSALDGSRSKLIRRGTVPAPSTSHRAVSALHLSRPSWSMLRRYTTVTSSWQPHRAFILLNLTEPTQLLHHACQLGDASILQFLLAHCADVDVNAALPGLENDIITPMHVCAYHGHAHLIAPLVAAGARVNRLSRHGRTPLSYAAELNHLTTAMMLLKSGAIMECPVSCQPMSSRKERKASSSPVSWNNNSSRRLVSPTDSLRSRTSAPDSTSVQHDVMPVSESMHALITGFLSNRSLKTSKMPYRPRKVKRSAGKARNVIACSSNLVHPVPSP